MSVDYWDRARKKRRGRRDAENAEVAYRTLGVSFWKTLNLKPSEEGRDVNYY